jgi:outer membrane biosynthesis protein TonB
MTPSSQPRKRKNSSRVNLLISLGIHGVIVFAIVYFAAREGMLGKQLKKLAVQMVKEPAPEKPKPQEKPKEEPPKVEPPKLDLTPKIAVQKEAPAPVAPPTSGTIAAPPVAAPPAVDVGGFEFDGGRTTTTVAADAVTAYRSLVQNTLRARWDRPSDMDDVLFVAEVEVDVDGSGQISDPVWKKGSGNKRWDDSVKAALAATRDLPLPPPKNFPSHVLVRFDVTEDSQQTLP